MSERGELAPNVRAYLNMIVDMQGSPPATSDLVYSLAELVRSFGLPMVKGHLPEGVEIGTPKFCYQNAAELALANPGRFIYCEGYAMGVIPVAHAWCVDLRTGLVVDPTWAAIGGVGEEYLGIPFLTEFLRLSLLNREVYGILENWEEGFPLLKAPLAHEPEKWLFSDRLNCLQD